MRGTDVIEEYLNSLCNGPNKGPVDRSGLDERLYPIADSLEALNGIIGEYYDFSVDLADGNLNAQIGKKNFMAGPLKDLQSSLRHFVWQTQRVAAGDYNQHIAFLGEFSDSFNEMINQLETRERIIKEHAELLLREAQAREALLEEQLQQQVTYYRSLAEANMELSRFRHDIKNHALTLLSLAQDNKNAQGIEYLQKLLGIVASRSVKINTGNYVMDALISQKTDSAQKHEIKVNSDINVPAGLAISDIDWCVILGNTLDNAIEACQKVAAGERAINISIKSAGNMLNIAIRNTYTQEPEINQETGMFKSTKGDSQSHGLGMTNVKLTVEKYDGSMETEMRDGVFILRILLCGIGSGAAF